MTILERMSADLGLSENYILSKINRSFIFYSKHLTYNKHGKKREVYEPSFELKLFQRWINENVLSDYPVSANALAYETGTSIRKNADAHRKSNYILHTDIRHFFESITFLQVRQLFEEKYAQEDIETILKIVTRNGSIPTGSLTAPRIANRIMYEFDSQIVEELSKIQQIVYTRYADDIIISSDTFLDDQILEITIDLLKKYGFAYNKKKTYYSNKRSKRNVTGVILNNTDNSLSIGWRKYKELKLKVYKYLKYNEGNKESIRGELAYLKSINPNKYLAIKKHYRDIDEWKELF